MRKLLIFALIIYSTSCFAKKLYKFQDENGVLHYTDKPPHTEMPVEVRQLKVEKQRYVWLEESGSKRHPEYHIRNNYFGPIEVEIGFSHRENILAKPELPGRFIIQPGISDTLIEVKGVNASKGWRFTLYYRYILGSSKATHDDSVAYLPPFAAGKEFPISQAFNGAFSHHDAQNQYAVDIVMPVGTPVHAARSGMVMEVENDYVAGGQDLKAYKSRANSIRIMHDDGSMAVYAHLQLEKSQVHPGMRVNAGQLIGYSGNTGFTTGPHLHFAVQVNKDMQLQSVPFDFQNAQGKRVKPVAGAIVARHQGQVKQ